ncbi:MAG: hypothetical protein RR231_12490 [Acinetobacter sp.]
MNNYQVSFYLGNENLGLKHRGIFTTATKEAAIKSAIKEFNPTGKRFHAVVLWGSPD